MVINECGIQKDTMPQKSAYLPKRVLSLNIISEMELFGKGVILEYDVVP